MRAGNIVAGLVVVLALLSGVLRAEAQQDHTLEGVVTDLDGRPMMVDVRHSGGVVRAYDGKFSITMHKTVDTLRFTATGYQTVIRVVAAGENLRIRMSPLMHEIEEVTIHTGYQRLRPNEVNGSVAVIGEAALQSRSGTNILSRIVGHSSGVLQSIGKSGSQTGITVRGLGTIEGPIDPLIVLDGYIYDGGIDNINPDDVENVSILKDASAASIWGARAGNGVIVITTKQGRIGQPMRVGAYATQLFSPVPELGKETWIGASGHVELERFLFENGYFDNRINNTPHLALTPVVEVLLSRREGALDSMAAEGMLAELSAGDKRQAYRDEFFRTGHVQRYGLDINGGGPHHAYLASGSYDRSKSNLSGTADRVNIRISHQYRLSDRLELTAGGHFVRQTSGTGLPAYGALSTGGRTPDYLVFRDGAGAPLPLDQQYRGVYTDTAGMGLLLDWKFYPAEDHRHRTNRSAQQELFANLSVRYRIIDFLSLTASYQQQLQRVDREAWSGEESFKSRDLINRYSQINRTTGVVNYIIPRGGLLESSYESVGSHTWRLQSDIHKLLGPHVVNAILGAEARESGTDAHTDATRYGYYADPLSFTLVDVINPYPEFLTGSNTRIGASTSLRKTRYRFLSFYGNASYSYRGKYIFSASVRKDGSNIFGANTNDKWKPLWSAGVGWRLSEEPFYRWAALPDMRLTATYGYSGNVDMSRTPLPIVSYSTYRPTQLRRTRIVSINNPDLRWEQLSQLSLKLDMSGWQDRMRLVLGGFYKRGSDLYGDAPYDYTGWGVTTKIVQNIADMEGYGLEVELYTKNLSRDRFDWNTDFYFNWNDTRTLDYYIDANTAPLSLLLSGGSSITPVKGYPLYGIAAHGWGGLDGSGNPQGYLDGALSTDYLAMSVRSRESGDNIEFIGSTSPRFYGSLGNTIRWRDWHVSFNLNYRMGYYFRKSALNYSQLVSSGRAHSEYLERWQQPGDERATSVPSFVYPANSNRDAFYSSSTVHVLRGDHIRLDYVNIGYSIQTAQWKRPFRKLEVHAGVHSAGILWRANKAGLDPDYPGDVGQTGTYTVGLRMSL